MYKGLVKWRGRKEGGEGGAHRVVQETTSYEEETCSEAQEFGSIGEEVRDVVRELGRIE